MSESNQAGAEIQMMEDAVRVVQATNKFLAERHISSLELERRTGLSGSAIRRMASEQEAKLSTLARIERACDAQIGTIARASGLVVVDDIRLLLASDPDLHPAFQRSGVENYDTWVKLSREFNA